jgi:hypothetical protein
MAGKIINAVMLKIVWISCVWGGATGYWWLGVAAVAVFAAWQIPRSPRPLAEIKLAAIAAMVGLVVDTAYIRTGLLAYPAPGPWQAVAPIWILALWIGFALSLNHSLAWLKGRPMGAALMGGIAGPFSFWFGATSWKAAEFVAPTPLVLAVLAFVWALIIPALVAVAERLHSVDPPSESSRMRLEAVPVRHSSSWRPEKPSVS